MIEWNNLWLFFQYAVILLLIFLCQVALGVFAFLEIRDEKDFKEKVEGSINKVFNGYGKNNETTELVNLIQSEVSIILKTMIYIIYCKEFLKPYMF